MHGAVTGFGSSTTALPYRLSSLCVSLHIRSFSKQVFLWHDSTGIRWHIEDKGCALPILESELRPQIACFHERDAWVPKPVSCHERKV